MKKIALLLIFALILSLVGCGGKPNGIRKGVYNLSLAILSTSDQYLDFKITADEAYEKINKLYERFNEFEDVENLSTQINEMSIKVCLHDLNNTFRLLIWYGEKSYDNILEKRNNLAVKLNEKTRK